MKVIDVLYETNVRRTYWEDAAIVCLASLVLSLSGRICIPLFFTPVPLTIQNILIPFFSLLLGRKRALLATMGLLFQAGTGLPVLSSGLFGWGCFFGPTGGYLMGYLLSSFFAGFCFASLGRKSQLNAFLSLSFMNFFVIYPLGMTVLAAFVGLKAAFFQGIVPFFFLDLCKILLATKALAFLKFFGSKEVA